MLYRVVKLPLSAILNLWLVVTGSVIPTQPSSAHLKVANLSCWIWPPDRKLMGKKWTFWDWWHESRKRMKTSHHFFFLNFNSTMFEVLNELRHFGEESLIFTWTVLEWIN